MIRRVVLTALLSILIVPTAALADSIDFGFTGGTANLYSNNLSNNPANGGTVSTWGSLAVIPAGLQIFSNLGTMTFTTGNWLACGNPGCTSGSYAGGGSIVFTTGSGFNAATGLSLGSGVNVFTGYFSDTTFIDCILTGGVCQAIEGNYHYNLQGTVTGSINPQILTLLGFNQNLTTSEGSLITVILNLNLQSQNGISTMGSGNMVVTPLSVPEPGTLALFGSGLLGLAAVVRRRLKA